MKSTDVIALVLLGSVAMATGGLQSLERASVALGGVPANGPSERPSVSADGARVAFSSYASNLVAADTNNGADVFVRLRASGVTVCVSVTTSGAVGTGASDRAAISRDGRWVAFTSRAADILPVVTTPGDDVFVRDVDNGVTELVSVATGGAPANGESLESALSADGRFVVFLSHATNLVANDGNGVPDVFVRDRLLGTTALVTVSTSGGVGNGTSLSQVNPSFAISADGRFVAFRSFASDLVANDANGTSDVFVRDLVAGLTTCVSVDPLHAPALGESMAPAISGEGRFVSFRSRSPGIVAGDTNSVHDAFVRDMALLVTERVSVGPGLVQADAQSAGATFVSDDGRFVAFQSAASVLVTGDANGSADVFLRDRQTALTAMISRTILGAGVAGASGAVHASPDARFVAFDSTAPGLVPEDADAVADVFLADRGPSTPFESLCFGDGSGAACPCANASPTLDRAGCLHSLGLGGKLAADGEAVVGADTLVLLGSQMTESSALYFQGSLAVGAGSGAPFGDGLRCAGGSAIRLGLASNVGGASRYPEPGDAPVSVQGVVTAGATRVYQVWFRNAASFCTAATFNLTNAVRIAW